MTFKRFTTSATSSKSGRHSKRVMNTSALIDLRKVIRKKKGNKSMHLKNKSTRNEYSKDATVKQEKK